MTHAVSISLGSSTRDKKVSVRIGNKTLLLERIGVDGDKKRAAALFAEMDGKIDAFGLGGVELFFPFGDRLYPFSSGHRLIQHVKITPVVDGSGVRQTLESKVVQVIEPSIKPAIQPRKAMMTAGVDRYDMACSLHQAGFQILFCDFVFGLGIPIPVKGMKNLLRLGRVFLPLVCQLPIQMIYPTGKSQEVIVPKYKRWYHYGPVIAGDFLQIRRHMPDHLDGKIIITNTTTEKDVDLLRERGVRYLVTTTPVFDGRSFGTNMLEAALVAYAGQGRALSTRELAPLLEELNVHPTLRKLND